jgi:hypothetical protein
MNASTLPSPSTRNDLIKWARRVLLSGGVVGAGCLMLAYVQVCHEAVERGERWRAEQRVLANAGTVVSQLSSR